MKRIIRTLCTAGFIAAAFVLAPNAAHSAVDVPPGTPPFLDLPFSDPAVTVLNGWYYSFDGRQNFCNYEHDLPGGDNHCSMDYVKRVNRSYVGFPVLAAADGTARRQSCRGCGTYIQIDHTVNGAQWCSRYLHLDPSRTIATGPVRQGQPIATAGNTGTNIIHLHWDVRPGPCSRWRNNQVDPFDIAGPLLRRGIAPTREYYPGGSRYAGCGPNAITLTCNPPPLP